MSPLSTPEQGAGHRTAGVLGIKSLRTHACLPSGGLPSEPLHPARAAAEDPHVHRLPGAAAGHPLRVRLLALVLHEDHLPRPAAAAAAHQVSRPIGPAEPRSRPR